MCGYFGQKRRLFGALNPAITDNRIKNIVWSTEQRGARRFARTRHRVGPQTASAMVTAIYVANPKNKLTYRANPPKHSMLPDYEQPQHWVPERLWMVARGSIL